MPRKALIAAAVTATLAAGGASAQSDAARLSEVAPQPVHISASMLEDARIVSLEGGYDENVWDEDAPLTALVADLTEIGDVDDVVLNPEGVMLGVTTDVGGFIGIGQKAVLIPLQDMRLVRSADGDDEITIVTRLDREQLEALQEFEVND